MAGCTEGYGGEVFLNTRSIGSRYESAACGYLIDKGYKILELPITLKYSRNDGTKSKVSLQQIKNKFSDTLQVKKMLKNKRL